MNIKNLIACICAALVALGSALWLADRRNIIDLTALMGSMHTPPTEKQTQAEQKEKPNQPTDSPQIQNDENDGKGGNTPQTQHDENDEKGGNTPQNLGSITVQETEEIAEPGADGVVRRSKITLPEEALAWTRPAQYPKNGDLLQITVPENHRFIIEVFSFEQLPQERGLVVLGALFNGKGRANLMLYESHFSLSIVDEEHRRIYNIYYDVTQNYYTVEEIDTTVRPALLPAESTNP